MNLINFVKRTEEKFAGLALEILKKIRCIMCINVYNLLLKLVNWIPGLSHFSKVCFMHFTLTKDLPVFTNQN